MEPHETDLVAGIAVEGQHVHVARCAGAEEYDVPQRRALRHQLGRHVGMVVDTDVVAGKDARQNFLCQTSHAMWFAPGAGGFTSVSTSSPSTTPCAIYGMRP